jgi:hypothetical protein
MAPLALQCQLHSYDKDEPVNEAKNYLLSGPVESLLTPSLVNSKVVLILYIF